MPLAGTCGTIHVGSREVVARDLVSAVWLGLNELGPPPEREAGQPGLLIRLAHGRCAGVFAGLDESLRETQLR